MSLEIGILGFLSMKPMSGYDIKKLFDMSASYFWPADQAQIYRTLKKMRIEGYIELKEQRKGETVDKKVYAITDSGQEIYLRSMTSSSAGDFILREPAPLQIFFSGALSRDEQLRLIDAQLESNRALLQEIEEHFTENKEAFRALAAMPGRDRRYQSALWARRWGHTRVSTYIDFLMQFRQEILEQKQSPDSAGAKEVNK